MRSLEDHIRLYEALTSYECDYLAALTDDSDISWGKVTSSGGPVVNLDAKKVWQHSVGKNTAADVILKKSAESVLTSYARDFPWYPRMACTDDGYLLKRYDQGEGFHRWHIDVPSPAVSHRVAIILWYLNEVGEGGETEFENGPVIKPEKGKALIFPANWLFPHRGCIPLSGPKYVATAWIGFSHG